MSFRLFPDGVLGERPSEDYSPFPVQSSPVQSSPVQALLAVSLQNNGQDLVD